MNDFLINPNQYPAPIISNKPAEVKSAESPQGSSFGEVLENAMQEVNDLQTQASDQTQKLMTGEITDIHSAMIAVQKADVSFQMMMQVRNKLVNAYQEIMKMQV